MSIIFFGNSKYSVIDAESIFKHFGLTTVVTIPDRYTTRKKILMPSPVKVFAEKHNIPVVTADTLNEQIIEQLKKIKPDFLVVADYRLILPKELLRIPKFAALNVHHSLLPKYRGTSPAPAAILAGEKISGVSIIKMVEKVDAGDILRQVRYELTPDETTDSLLTRLNELGGQAVVEVIENFGNIQSIKQDESKTTFTKYMTKQDGYIDPDKPPNSEQLDRMIRAYYPWPTVWTRLRLVYGGQAKEKIIKFLPEQKIQPEGKKPMTIKDFLNGYPEAREWLEQLLGKKQEPFALS